MRKFFMISMTALLIPFTTFAHDPSSPLHQSMKQLGTITKQLVATVGDASQNQVNAQNVLKMIELFKVSFDHAAEAVEDLPATEQAAATAEIQDLVKQEIELANQLEAAFVANDNTSAKLILQKMVDIKKEGHDKYK